MSTEPESHPAGTLRYTRPGDAAPIVVSPHNPFYSTASMLATHYWSTVGSCWLPIDQDEQEVSGFSL